MPLVFVPTPLGNLRDITLRALDVLRDCNLLVAEDSRVAKRLLNALALPGKEVWSYHEHNAAAATANILARARTQLVAVTTDAGTPGISDPGSDLLAAARAEGIAVEVLPGASAAIGAAVLSGFAIRRFCFEGFPPRSSRERRHAFERALASGVPTVWYESPQRIRASLADLDAVNSEARVFLLREYTKVHEQQALGSPAQINAALEEPVRGEIAFVIDAGLTTPAEAPGADEVDDAIRDQLALGLPVATIAKTLAERGFGERRELYARATDLKRVERDARAPRR
jgi:16S rRNA (cytidine1402-2'-O)-methyltransferase